MAVTKSPSPERKIQKMKNFYVGVDICEVFFEALQEL